MVQIKHFTAPQKVPNFQFSRRAKWPWRDKILGVPPARPENYCESKQTYFSYSLDKAFHCGGGQGGDNLPLPVPRSPASRTFLFLCLPTPALYCIFPVIM